MVMIWRGKQKWKTPINLQKLIVHFVVLLTPDYFLSTKTFNLLSPRWISGTFTKREHEIPLLSDFVQLHKLEEIKENDKL